MTFRGGENDDETAGGMLRVRAGVVSASPESDVVVVLLVPEPLRIRRLPLGTRGMLPFDSREGGGAT